MIETVEQVGDAKPPECVLAVPVRDDGAFLVGADDQTYGAFETPEQAQYAAWCINQHHDSVAVQAQVEQMFARGIIRSQEAAAMKAKIKAKAESILNASSAASESGQDLDGCVREVRALAGELLEILQGGQHGAGKASSGGKRT